MTLAEHLNAVADDLYKRRAALPKDATVSCLSLDAACAAIKDAVRFLPRALARQEITEEVGHVTTQRRSAHEPAADGAKSQAPTPPPAEGPAVRRRNACKVCGGTDYDGRRHRFDGARAARAAAAPAEAPASDDEDPEPAAAERGVPSIGRPE